MLAAQGLQQAGGVLPFAVYSSVREQRIHNVPIAKPTLICVLEGRKRLSGEGEIDCPPGSFVVLSNRPGIDMRNIPAGGDYFALIIEFDFDDFACLPARRGKPVPYLQGRLETSLLKTLEQFVAWAAFAPPALWPLRRQEILQLLFHLGYQQVGLVMQPPGLGHRVHAMVCADLALDAVAADIASRLALSESSLRRKLKAEGTSLQEIKDRARLGHGLHLLQTTMESVGRVAERCGYQSQSRFTDKFKQAFGVTPSELRKTRMRDSGEYLADSALILRGPDG